MNISLQGTATLVKMFTVELSADQTDFHQFSCSVANHKSYPCHLQGGSYAQVSGDDLEHSTGHSESHIPGQPERTYFPQTSAKPGDVSCISSEIYAHRSPLGPTDRGPSVARGAGSSHSEPSDRLSSQWLSTEHIYPWMREARPTHTQSVATSISTTGWRTYDVLT